MPQNRWIQALIASAAFALAVVATTAILQDSLWVYRNFGATAHWAMILLLTPLVCGLTLGRLGVPLLIPALLLGSAAATLVLFPLYRDVWWLDPPTRRQALVFSLVIAGVAYMGVIKYRAALRAIFRWRDAAAREIPLTPARQPTAARGRLAPNRRRAPPAANTVRRAAPAKRPPPRREPARAQGREPRRPAAAPKPPPRKIMSLLTSAEYSGLLATLQFIIALSSLLLSVASIFSMSR